MSSTTSAGSGLHSRWRKSSYSESNGHCLEAAFRKSSYSYHEANCLEAAWRKSSHSTYNGNCTEVVLASRGEREMVAVRDSKLGDGSPVLEFSPAAWSAFLEGIKA